MFFPGRSAVKVLLVEDDRKIIAFAKKGLKNKALPLTRVAMGDDAYHLAVTQAYDVIVLDIMLPGPGRVKYP